jgi:hypothetical protein
MLPTYVPLPTCSRVGEAVSIDGKRNATIVGTVRNGYLVRSTESRKVGRGPGKRPGRMRNVYAECPTDAPARFVPFDSIGVPVEPFAFRKRATGPRGSAPSLRPRVSAGCPRGPR